MTANTKQVGGDHYTKLAIQPWDYIAQNKLGYFEGTVIEYLTCWRDPGRNGVEDIKKAIHYLEKLLEVEKTKPKQAAKKSTKKRAKKPQLNFASLREPKRLPPINQPFAPRDSSDAR